MCLEYGGRFLCGGQRTPARSRRTKWPRRTTTCLNPRAHRKSWRHRARNPPPLSIWRPGLPLTSIRAGQKSSGPTCPGRPARMVLPLRGNRLHRHIAEVSLFPPGVRRRGWTQQVIAGRTLRHRGGHRGLDGSLMRRTTASPTPQLPDLDWDDRCLDEIAERCAAPWVLSMDGGTDSRAVPSGVSPASTGDRLREIDPPGGRALIPADAVRITERRPGIPGQCPPSSWAAGPRAAETPRLGPQTGLVAATLNPG